MNVDDGGVLSANHLSVSYAGKTVLDGVSFGLKPGEFCGLIGSNGSGKTTLLRALLGFQSLDAGEVRIDGKMGKAGLHSVGYVPQKIMLDAEIPLRARDLVTLGLTGKQLGFALNSRAVRQQVDAMLREVGAESFADERIGNLSGGQQQRVLIAHALIRRPRLLLLDEPLANLDIRSVSEIVALLRHLCIVHQVSILLSAHDMNPLLSSMDSIVYLANGRAASGKTDEIVQSDVLSRLYGYPIEVLRVMNRVLVIAANASSDVCALTSPPENLMKA
ncbi:metal ABC transporter ATP-binding protein [Rouxiella badensis]|jgi:zinc/manganese transport system ATP-binding protein|uniref:metal ABC transporter ATP-binding protein n=1 Tax=Rouxiella badensis TaxID=1646377 RepID=UPI001D14D583|nr:metal ABC transporter ATP-binding protein [Rouxiella badensis]MCC3701752.1 metal ABC transporter ATP-binding protein [Rouxiella badensis]MCC3731394.1 metal ABC transporter ATP-binding protein [Rouxiella badensis]MCC3756783.1 metal ABC transporter ATP-binding protein [Rouxiella badensis]WAT10490.1 metal ABC transporter ATP-binding protein [Rouxiella badensis]